MFKLLVSSALLFIPLQAGQVSVDIDMLYWEHIVPEAEIPGASGYCSHSVTLGSGSFSLQCLGDYGIELFSPPGHINGEVSPLSGGMSMGIHTGYGDLGHSEGFITVILRLSGAYRLAGEPGTFRPVKFDANAEEFLDGHGEWMFDIEGIGETWGGTYMLEAGRTYQVNLLADLLVFGSSGNGASGSFGYSIEGLSSVPEPGYALPLLVAFGAIVAVRRKRVMTAQTPGGAGN